MAFASTHPTYDVGLLCTEEFTIPVDGDVRLYGWAEYARPVKPRAVALTVSMYGTPVPDHSEPDRLERAYDNPLMFLGTEDFARAWIHVRGVGSSEGLFDMFGARTKCDMKVVLDYIASQSWCNGRIIAIGLSGSGCMAYPLAASKHPALKAAVPMSSPGLDLYRARFRGVTPEFLPAFIGEVVPAQLDLPRNLEARKRLGLRSDVIADQKAAVRAVCREARQRFLRDEFWEERSNWDLAPVSDVPVMLFSSWLDTQALSHPEIFRLFPNAWLFMGGGHDGPLRITDSYGFPWCARFLRHFALGEDNGFDREPRLLLPIGLGSRTSYAYGRTLIRAEELWPLEGTRWERLYLSSTLSGSASSINDGSLQLSSPGFAVTPATVEVAANPPQQLNVRSGQMRLVVWMNQSATPEPQAAGMDWSRMSSELRRLATPPPQLASVSASEPESVIPIGDRLADLRFDEETQLTYTTGEFRENVEITGPVTVHLFASSNVTDFVWIVRVTDVHPDGTSMWVADVIHRAAHRRLDHSSSVWNDEGDVVLPQYTYDMFEPMPAGEIVECHIPCSPISNVFKPGHRLRLDIGCMKCPEGNRDAAGGSVLVHHDSEHRSSILLPLIPARLHAAKISFDEVEHPGESAVSIKAALAT